MKSFINLDMVDLQGDGCHLFISCKINGKEAKMLVDSGASRSAFDIEQIKKYIVEEEHEANQQLTTGLGSNTVQSYFSLFDEFQLGDFVLRNYQAVLLDMSHVNASYQAIGLEEIVGVIGGDILLDYKAIIDYKKKILLLRTHKRNKIFINFSK
ncbi:MAG: retropepsin-like aspartic protease [Bacteroidota bacterium]